MSTSDDPLARISAAFLRHPEGPAAEFLAVPGTAPRWLLPVCRGNLDRVLASWTPYRLTSRMLWNVIRLANGRGLLQALPGIRRVHLRNVNEIDWQSYGWRGIGSPIPLIYVGTAGPRQKAVIHLIDAPTGNCLAVVKAPLGAEAKDAIVQEAGVLSALAEEGYPFSPRLLHRDDSRGIAAQQFVPGKSGKRRFAPEYQELLRSLALRDEMSRLVDHAAAWHEQALGSLANAGRGELGLVQLALAELDDEHPLPRCWTHGDFAPWNIRQRTPGVSTLLDWEEAVRGGLPLQDAYHFLHLQDFLFGAQPRTHFAEVEAFAKTLEITPPRCRKLEIAYLVQAWLKCNWRGDRLRASYLLQTIALALRDHSASAWVERGRSRRLRLVSSHTPNIGTGRAQLLDTLVTQLNHAALPYCFLSGHEGSSATATSDVDIMFRPRDLHRLPSLLARVAQSAGAKLVQSIQHETSACYFVLARHEERHIAHLEVDCYSDYRRQRRAWLMAEKMLAGRRQGRCFSLPAVEDEFIYYVIKKILKQSITAGQLKRLQHLLARDPRGCKQGLARFWSGETASLLQQAIVAQDLAWMQRQLPMLLAELQRSPMLESPVRRVGQTLCAIGRILRRIRRPTGLSVVVTGSNRGLCAELADGLVCDLAPAFRRARRIWMADTVLSALAQPLKVWAARVRSTLVVRSASDDFPDNGGRRGLRRLVSGLARLCIRTDVRLVLRSGPSPNSAKQSIFFCRTIFLDADQPPEQILHAASAAILNWLALRTEKRLKLQGRMQQAVDHASEPAALGSAGLD